MSAFKPLKNKKYNRFKWGIIHNFKDRTSTHTYDSYQKMYYIKLNIERALKKKEAFCNVLQEVIEKKVDEVPKLWRSVEETQAGRY